MDIQIAVLCDAATNYSEKLNILGTFDTIYSPKFPAMHPQCAVAIRMAFNKSEEGRHMVRIQLVDEDGKPCLPTAIPEMPVEVMVPEDSFFLSRNIIVNFQNLTFQKEGLYSLDIVMDGRQERSIPLLVRSPKSGSGAQHGFQVG